MQWRKFARFGNNSSGQTRARRMLCCGRRKESGRAVPDVTASPGRAPPQQTQAVALRNNHNAAPLLVQSDFRKVSGISTEIFKQIEQVENDHDATTAAALEAVERRGEMIVRILELRQVGRNALEMAKKFFALQDPKHNVQLVEIVKRPGQTLGLYIREGDGMVRTDGVFISRIALESAVYSSGCLKVGDEILAVNLVDVRRMSLDDVVIIMSIPRRLLLVTRQRKAGKSGPGSPSLPPRSDHKPPPVVVMKRDLRDDDERSTQNYNSHDGSLRQRHTGDGREERNRTAAGFSPESADLYYSNDQNQLSWRYGRTLPPVITEQPKYSPYERFSSEYSRTVPRSGSEQALPRTDTDFGRHSLLRSSLKAANATGSSLSRYNQRYGGLTTSGLTGPSLGVDSPSLSGSALGVGSPSLSALGGYAGTGLISSSNYGGSTIGASGLGSSTVIADRYGSTYGTTGIPTGGSALGGIGVGTNSLISGGLTGLSTGYSTLGSAGYGTLGSTTKLGARRNRSIDYSSDTEASCPTRAPYYMGYRGTNPTAGPTNSAIARDLTTKFNSLPRDVRVSSRLALGKRLPGLLPDEPEHPEQSLASRLARGRLTTSPSVFTSDEYKAWLSRAPSTSALYDVLRPRVSTHYSAENIHDALKNLEASSRFGSSLGLATRNNRSMIPPRSLSTQQLPSALSRRHLDLDSALPSPVPTPSVRTQRHLDINPNEFLKYKLDKPQTGLIPSMSSSISGLSRLAGSGNMPGGVSGMLWVHLLSGRGLRDESVTHGMPHPRDLYCVLECDRVHKARTVVRTGDLQFDWDESFELDLVDNRQLELLVYSWDPQHRHKLCCRGAVRLPELLSRTPSHRLAVKVEPRGTLYVRLRHTEPSELYRRRVASPRVGASVPSNGVFGVELEAVVAREIRPPSAPPVPLLVRRCVEEIERRGLDIIGLYRLCGSATKKRILREAFERNARTVELAPDSVPDINVITGLLKDYLRELPQPLFSRTLYQVTLDTLGVCLPDDPTGNAALVSRAVECLPRAARATLVFLLDHLALVAAASDRNKMSPQQLAAAMAPPLMLHAPRDLEHSQPISLLKCILQIWPAPTRSVGRGEPASVLGQHGNKATVSQAAPGTHIQGRRPPSVIPYRQAAAASAVSQRQVGPSAQHSPVRSPVQHVLSSAKVGQYPPRSPRGPPQQQQHSTMQTARISSPVSPTSSSDSQSGAETIKRGGSASSILKQPDPNDSDKYDEADESRERSSTTPLSTTPRAASPRTGIPGTSAGLAVTLNDSPLAGVTLNAVTSQAVSAPLSAYALPPYSSTNPFLQNYDPQEETEAWRAAADIFTTRPPPS